jgi:hypothetical protein
MFDTAFSVYFLYVFAFIVIHSLTKSFQLQTEKDPLYDLFHHSEYFHLWLTHLVTYVGAMTIVAFFAGFNVFFPLSLELGRIGFYSSIFLAIICGALFFVALWIADPKQDGANFMRIMKLIAAVLFIILVGVYFVFNPAFNSQYLFFWFGLFSFASVVSCSAFAYKSVKAKNFFERFVEKHSNNQSFKNIQLFRKK